MDSEKLVCVICGKSKDKIILFNENTLEKCQEILLIRQLHKLKYKDVVLPLNVNLKDGYHTHCHKNFLAVMKKYYDNTSRESDIRQSGIVIINIFL